jgi:hypothetical protein
MTEQAQPASSPYTVREVSSAEAPKMRALFEQIFKKEMSQALWDWKYTRGGSVGMGVWRGDELVAHYGGMAANILFKGTPGPAVQICDVMVNQSLRQAVRKSSLFYLATSAFIERYGGYGNRFPCGYGFPSDRHMELAEHLKFYAPVGRMWELNWDLAAAPRMPLLLKTVAIDSGNFEQHRATLDNLAEQQCAAMPDRVLVRKNAAWVEWRFLRHPHERYELLLVTHRLSGKVVGLCVLKVEPERVLWMDALAPTAHLPALAQVARAAAWRLERRKLSLWCSEPDRDSFGAVGAAEALPIITPANIWTPGPTPEELHNRWWLLTGDTDYL